MRELGGIGRPSDMASRHEASPTSIDLKAVQWTHGELRLEPPPPQIDLRRMLAVVPTRPAADNVQLGWFETKTEKAAEKFAGAVDEKYFTGVIADRLSDSATAGLPGADPDGLGHVAEYLDRLEHALHSSLLGDPTVIIAHALDVADPVASVLRGIVELIPVEHVDRVLDKAQLLIELVGTAIGNPLCMKLLVVRAIKAAVHVVREGVVGSSGADERSADGSDPAELVGKESEPTVSRPLREQGFDHAGFLIRQYRERGAAARTSITDDLGPASRPDQVVVPHDAHGSPALQDLVDWTAATDLPTAAVDHAETTRRLVSPIQPRDGAWSVTRGDRRVGPAVRPRFKLDVGEPRHVAIVGLPDRKPYSPELRGMFRNAYDSEVLPYPIVDGEHRTLTALRTRLAGYSPSTRPAATSVPDITTVDLSQPPKPPTGPDRFRLEPRRQSGYARAERDALQLKADALAASGIATAPTQPAGRRRRSPAG